jgi:hypothetical protein
MRHSSDPNYKGVQYDNEGRKNITYEAIEFFRSFMSFNSNPPDSSIPIMALTPYDNAIHCCFTSQTDMGLLTPTFV